MTLTDLVYIDSTGYHFADYPSFQTWLIQQYQAIYGADVYLQPDSQDGQFLGILAQALFDTASLGASIYNSFSPSTAQGAGLSRNVKINGLKRQIPSNSTAELTIIGTAGTVITDGVAQDSLQQKWNLPSPTTIPGGGTITVTATAQAVGAIQAEAATITTIFTPTLGWQSVNNAAAATAGAPVESDAELRVRQTESTANPSLTVVDGTAGAILNTAGVQKQRTYENDTGSTDGDGVPAHSICSVVVGGDDVAVAQVIALHKTPGAGTFGDTTELVYDAHGMPLNISFQRAETATIQCTVTLSAGTGWSTAYEALIQAAIANLINSGRIGDNVLYTKMFGAAYLQGNPAGATFDVATITLGKNGGGQGAANVSLDFDENPVCIAGTDVTIVVT